MFLMHFFLSCSYSASSQPAYNQGAYSQAGGYSQPQGGYQAQQPGYGQQQQSSYGQPPQQGPPAAYPPQGNSAYAQPQYGQQSASQNDYSQQSAYSKGQFHCCAILPCFCSLSCQFLRLSSLARYFTVCDLSCRQLQSGWRLLRITAAGWIPRRSRQRWLSGAWGYGPRRHGVSSGFLYVTNCSLLFTERNHSLHAGFVFAGI